MDILISLSEQQLESLNRLVTAGVVSIDAWTAESSPEVHMAHEWLTEARQALVAAQEGQTELQNPLVITPGQS